MLKCFRCLEPEFRRLESPVIRQRKEGVAIMRFRISNVTLIAALLFTTGANAQSGVCRTAADVAALPAGHWCEVPNSALRSAEKAPSEYDDWNGSSSPKYSSFQRTMGVAGVTAAWSSAAFDTKRNCLLVTGGGHNDYGGNEVYKFCLNDLRWTRLTDPTVFPNRAPAHQNSDGSPISRHTYGGLAYLAAHDRFFVFDGSPDERAGSCGLPGTWTLDLAARDSAGSYSPSQWELRTMENEPKHSCGTAAAYDVNSGNVIVKSQLATHSYNFSSNRWSQIGSSGRRNDYVSLAIDPGRRMLVEVGKGVTALWSMDKGFTGGEVSTSGATSFQSFLNPGLAYDLASDLIVGWSGGTTVYTLDVDNRVWTAVAPAATNAANPGSVSTSGGVYGRFNYSPTYNVYMYVDLVFDNVFLYRLGEGEVVVTPLPPINLTPD